MKKVLITGGAGFIGSHILDYFKEKGFFCAVVDNLSTGKIENTRNSDVFYNIDIRDEGKLMDIFKEHKFDFVIHQAAQVSVNKSINNPIEDLSINIVGSLNLINLCKKFLVNKIILASTAAVYGEKNSLPIKESDELSPICPYGISKMAMEFYVKCSGLNYGIFRYSNVYGPRQYQSAESGVISIFCNNIKNKTNHIVFGDGEQTRDFIYVENVAKVIFNYCNSDLNSQILNLSSNTSITINKLISTLNKISEINLPIIYKEPRPNEIIHSRLDNSNIIKLNLINNDTFDFEMTINNTLKLI